jgi:hypothetical protein
MQIYINKPVALADQKIEISVSGLPPKAALKLRAAMSLPWAEKVIFGSAAEFIADENGCVDLSKHAPVSGDYLTADSMGLITSMRSATVKINAIADNISVDRSLFIDISAECGNDKASVRIERLFM